VSILVISSIASTLVLIALALLVLGTVLPAFGNIFMLFDMLHSFDKRVHATLVSASPALLSSLRIAKPGADPS
jgi:hypothetical protein